MMDYQKGSVYLRHIYPPKIKEEEVLLFSDSLEEIVSGKLEELIKRQDEVKLRNKYWESILSEKNLNDFDFWFWTYWKHVEFQENDYIDLWLKYWIRISSIVTHRQTDGYSDTNITEDDIARAKDVPLEFLYEGRLLQRGERLLGSCPFHEEKTPSFVIFEDNHWFCFGCTRSGDSIEFYKLKHKVSFIQAVKALNAQY